MHEEDAQYQGEDGHAGSDDAGVDRRRQAQADDEAALIEDDALQARKEKKEQVSGCDFLLRSKE